MTFALSGSTITQSGTDTSYAGLNGLAGVTRLLTGDGYLYYMPTLILNVTGTLTIADPSKDTFIASKMSVAGTGNFTSGSYASDGVTPLRGGTHFQCVAGEIGPDAFNGGGSLQIGTGGRFTTIGGQYILAAGVHYQTGAIIREYYTDVVAASSWGTNSSRIRAYSADVIKRKCRHFDVGYDLFKMPTEFSVQAFGSVYVSQYVGGAYSGGADAKFVASSLSNPDTTSADFDNWGAGWVELYNCAKGANLLVTSSASRANHCVPLYQDINFTVTNLSGVAQQNVRLRCIDAPVSNSPTTTITTTGSLKAWDFRNAQTYTGTTDAAGRATLSPVLQVWHGASNLKNLRFPASTATIRLVGYAVRQQDVQVVLGSDAAIAKGVALVPATGITLTKAQAGALTGIAFVASGTNGGTVTVTEARTTAEVWQAWRYWKGLLANADSADGWEYASSGLLNTGAWNMVNNGTITGSIVTTGTVTGAGTVTGSIEDSTGVRVTVTKSGGGNFNISARKGTTGAYTALGYQAGVSTVTYTVPKGTPIEIVAWSLGYVTYTRLIDTSTGGVALAMEMTPNAAINTSLDVSAYLASITTSVDLTGAYPVFVVTINAPMTVPDIEYAKTLVHRLVSSEVALSAGFPPGSVSILAINVDEITIAKPAIRIELGAGVTTTQRVYLDAYFNRAPALALNPAWELAPVRADGNQVQILRTKPSLDPGYLAAKVVAAMPPNVTLAQIEASTVLAKESTAQLAMALAAGGGFQSGLV